MRSEGWKWGLGLTYIFAVATIWIGASFVVQSVVDAGVSPFLVTYICNSLFVIYIPLVEIIRYLEDTYGTVLFWRRKKQSFVRELTESEEAILLGDTDGHFQNDSLGNHDDSSLTKESESGQDSLCNDSDTDSGLDAKGRWTRTRVAKISLLICPFWFLAQLTFNLSLKYTTVTSNTILSSTSSLFTFLVALAFLGEKFSWVKLVSVLLCMGGTIIVSLGDSKTESTVIATNPVLGDVLALLSAALYAVYITLIHKNLPDQDDENPTCFSMAQFLGFLGLFNLVIFLPVAIILHFSKLEPFNTLTRDQLSLIVGKGLLDNVLSDYMWAKAVLLTSTTVASAGLTIQVPLAAILDTITGNSPSITEYIGAASVMIGFAGINIPENTHSTSTEAVSVADPEIEMEIEIRTVNNNNSSTDQELFSPT